MVSDTRLDRAISHTGSVRTPISKLETCYPISIRQRGAPSGDGICYRIGSRMNEARMLAFSTSIRLRQA
jgi:hypothetical protein